MKINLEKINQNDFRVSEREHPEIGSVVLVTPGFDKHRWALDEVHLRSLLCLPSGEVLSSGLVKFCNHTEDPIHDVITNDLIVNGKVWFTEKVDGSMVIRFVYKGKVYFRTRGSHHLSEEFHAPVMNLVRDKYPKMLDPTLFEKDSVIFEYTAPDNKIILEYKEAGLTVLGLVETNSNRSQDLPFFCGTPTAIESISEKLGVPGVKFHEMADSFDDIITQVRAWDDSEGLVVRMHAVMPNDSNVITGPMYMTKIKADRYLRLHSLKFYMTTDKIKQFCWIKDVETQEQLKSAMYAIGIDWEAVEFILPDFEAYISNKKGVEDLVSKFIATLDDEKVSEFPTRKEIALRLKELTKGDKKLFGIGIAYATGESEKTHRLTQALILGISVGYLDKFYELGESLVQGLALGRKNGDKQ